ARAVEGHQEALGMDPSQPTSRAALDQLLASTTPGIAVAAARALSPVLESESAWERLVTVLDRIASETDDVDEKRRCLARAAEVCEIGLNNPSRAFGYAAREIRESLGEPDLRVRLDLLDRLANAANLYAEQTLTLKELAPDLVDPDLQIEAFMKVAQIAQERLNDREAARAYYEKALEQRPDHAPALDALEKLHEGASAFPELLDALRRKTELATSDTDRRELLRKQARICEQQLNDRAGAARAYESILEIAHEADAAEALERIYAAESRWDDLTSLLENQLGLPGADVVSLHHRLGVVAAKHQNNPDRALEHFREVLDRQSDHQPTVTALEELAKREGYEARVAEMLEPIYLSRMDWPNVISAMEARIAAETDVTTRKELLTRLGSLYEESLEDLDKALDTFARVFREDVTDHGSWELVARLAKLLGRFDRQAEIYAGALETITSDDDSTAELAYQAGGLFDRHVHDTQKARALYRRALAFDPSRREVFDALEALLTLGTLARERPDSAGLLPNRVHGMFRGLHGLYAGINPCCSGRQAAPGEQHVVGKLFSVPQTRCDACGARVFELASCRSCGSAYLITYAKQGTL
ncbi:MAG: tetratricopeptide repeat protein, partial [Deltaproteobacteria bacterium]